MITLYAVAFDCHTGLPIAMGPAHRCDIRTAAHNAADGALWAVRYGYATTDRDAALYEGMDTLYEGPAPALDLPYLRICSEKADPVPMVSTQLSDDLFELVNGHKTDTLYSSQHGAIAHVIEGADGSWSVRLADASVRRTYPTRARAKAALWDERTSVASDVGEYASLRRARHV